MKRKYRAQAFIAGSSCVNCSKELCARASRKNLNVIIYCCNHQRRAEEKP